MKPDEKLAWQANQIAMFFAAQGEERARLGVADHIAKYWTSDMRHDFLAAAAKDGSNLHPAVRAALPLIESPGATQR